MGVFSLRRTRGNETAVYKRKEGTAMLTAIVGINWGDEGKGRMVDLLSEGYDIVCRYQGGNNAGHTIVVDGHKFILNLLPSGILHPGVVNVMGPGMVVDLQHLGREIQSLREKGVSVSPQNLKLSKKACICMPCHVRQDILEEERLADARYGSTRRGIAPIYGDKYMKKALHLEELLEPERLKERLAGILDWKNLMLEKGYGASPEDFDQTLAWLKEWGEPLIPYLCDTGLFLQDSLRQGKNVLFEAQLGALRDIDFGIYPYTSSSSTLAGYAPIGAGIPGSRLDCTIGIMKAYSTCVGEGPFTVEWFGEQAEELRRAGGEYGAATGRPRRVGPFDAVASRYGVRMQGADALALTKMDVLSALKEIPICTAYEVDGTETTDFPSGDELLRAKPVLQVMEGWNCDISGCRSFADLPGAARQYIEKLEQLVECPIRYVSVGADREAYFTR